MPKYDYKCTQCKTEYELEHSINVSPDPCKMCGAVLRKVFSTPGIAFKGSGFYTTDNRK